MHIHTNKLAGESSPYLLQHAHNPVDWYPWGAEALQKARVENKPILVSIGYAACHWCHVMERESFEDEATAAVMNEHFVNIKIDREERPDLDHIYMDAVQAMTGSGGWPLNVFLTPEAKPFYGGTYFPPHAAFNRPSWQDVLHGVAKAFRETPHEVISQAENLTAHVEQANSWLQSNRKGAGDEEFTAAQLDTLYQNLMKAADRQEGGFGKAPKFPQTFSIQFLLRYYSTTKQTEALDQACLSLDKMIQGGIYDQIGGGFARYSTDREWLVPHFEKMLYDNALLVSTLSEACQLTHKELYRHVIHQTIGFVQRELTSAEGGFFSALDADSEGEEGKFYVWQKEEVEQVLGEEASLFCAYYDVTEKGNWEEKNILRVLIPAEEFARQNGLSQEALQDRLQAAGNRLLQARSRRMRPQLDDKILLGWNALMNTGLSKAYAATGEEEYKRLAISNMDFMLEKFRDPDTGGLFHTYKEGTAKYPAFLDDYASLIQALIHLQEITGDTRYLRKANELAERVINHFGAEGGLFYFTHQDQQDVIVRKQEVYDGATPAGNSLMAGNLLYLGIVFDQSIWKERVVNMLKAILETTIKYPTSFGNWAVLMWSWVEGMNEVVVAGENLDSTVKEILHIFMPNKVLQIFIPGLDNSFPLLRGKEAAKEPVIFVCKDYACHTPVTNVESFIRLLTKSNAESYNN
ncbi:MAG: thioredoxin domain-containing protein [Williamsia sp.]|nr:thioredoxin domain-containing protein [Williamsia sp.]